MLGARLHTPEVVRWWGDPRPPSTRRPGPIALAAPTQGRAFSGSMIVATAEGPAVLMLFAERGAAQLWCPVQPMPSFSAAILVPSTRALISAPGVPWARSGKPMFLRTFICG